MEILICTQDCEAGKPWKDLWAETCARDLSAPHAVFIGLTQLQSADKKTAVEVQPLAQLSQPVLNGVGL